MIFLVVSVSAFDFDNKLNEKTITFDGKSIQGNELLTKYPPIEIKNSFGFGKTLLEGYLSQHTSSCGVDCSSTIEINLLEDGVLIDDVIFRDLNGDLTTISYQFYMVQDGNKIPYVLGQNVNAGTYQILLEGQKDFFQTVDWVISSQGQWVDEWAWWYSSSEWNDDFEDGIINQTLWKNYTGVGGVGNGIPETVEVISSDGYVKIKVYVSTGATSSSAVAVLETQSNYKGSGNYTFMFIMNGSKDGAGDITAVEISDGGVLVMPVDIGIDKKGLTLKNFNNGELTGTPKNYSIEIIDNGTAILRNSTGDVLVSKNISSLSVWKIRFRSSMNVGSDTRTALLNVFDFTMLSDEINVTLNSPENNTVVDNPVLFNCIASTWWTLQNISLYGTWDGGWSLNETVSVSGSENSTNFTFSLPDGDYLWNCEVCYNSSICVFAYDNYTLNVDTTLPTVNITYPIITSDFNFIGENETLNWTVSDINLDACWYDYNNTNTTVTCNDNSTIFVLVEDWYNITFWVNDTVGNTNSSFFEWEYKILVNSQTYTSHVYETASETFTINITANSSLTSSNLIHNGISYSSTKSGTIYSTTFDIPSSVGNKTFYWDFTYAGDSIVSYNNTQHVNNTLLGICNASQNLTVSYINFTFIDEETSSNINATIDTSTWTYYLGSGTVTKELLFSNNSVNNNYAFCLSASNHTLYNTRSVQYSSPGYPQRKYDASSDLTNSTTNKILYLLSSTDGIYTTIQVLDTESNQLLGVEVTTERQFSGIWTVVGEETTDSAGAVTFWVNPDYDHRFTFVKEGCTGTTITIRPTQTQYTQQLACGVTSDYVATIEGLKYSRTPVGGIIQPRVYNFTYYLISSKDNIINASFYLVNASDQTVLNSSVSSCTVSGCLLFFTYNVSSGDDLKGRYYVDVGNGSILLEGDAWWRCIYIPTGGKTGIGTLFQDIIFIFQEWGDDSNTADFNRLVFIFFIMCVSISVLNYHFNMDSMNPGMFLTLLTFFIIMGSIVGGANPTVASHGIFYYNNLTTNAFINNYLLAGICMLITLSSFLNVNRQAQR